MEKDKEIRESISKMLGKYKSYPYASMSRDVEILSWPEIYFELGKLKHHVESLGDYTSILNRLSIIEDRLNDPIKN